MSKPVFDPSLMDYAALRKQKRKKLLIWSAPAVALAILIMLWFVLPTVLTGRAIPQYKHGNYGSARRWITPLTWTSPEPFVAAYNSGTADAAQEKFERAEKELTRALAIAPKNKRCMTARNLVYAFNTHAAKLRTIPSKETTATALAKQSANVVSTNKQCFLGAASSGGGGSSSSSASDSQSPSESQQQQLQQKEQEGKDRQAQFARDEVYNPDDPSIKPW